MWVIVPVAVREAMERLPEKRPLPCTAKEEDGVLVPTPTLFQNVESPVTVAVDDAENAPDTERAAETVDDACDTKPPASVARPETAADEDAENAPPTVATPRTSSVPVAMIFVVKRSNEVMRDATPSVVPGVVEPIPTFERKSPLPATTSVDDALTLPETERAAETVEDACDTKPPASVASPLAPKVDEAER